MTVKELVNNLVCFPDDCEVTIGGSVGSSLPIKTVSYYKGVKVELEVPELSE